MKEYFLVIIEFVLGGVIEEWCGLMICSIVFILVLLMKESFDGFL